MNVLSDAIMATILFACVMALGFAFTGIARTFNLRKIATGLCAFCAVCGIGFIATACIEYSHSGGIGIWNDLLGMLLIAYGAASFIPLLVDRFGSDKDDDD